MSPFQVVLIREVPMSTHYPPPTSPDIPGSIFSAFSQAVSYPSATSVGERPIRSSSSALAIRAPDNTRTKLVPSPTCGEGEVGECVCMGGGGYTVLLTPWGICPPGGICSAHSHLVMLPSQISLWLQQNISTLLPSTLHYPTSYYLLFHHLCCHDHHLGSWMLHLQLLDDRACIFSHKKLLQMVDHHFIHAFIETER